AAREAREKALAVLDEAVTDARTYHRAKRAAESDSSLPMPDVNAKMEGMMPVLEGDLPLFIHAFERNQIADALDWAAEQELDNLVLVTSGDVRYLADRLAEENVPVILNGVLALPDRRWEAYDTPFTTAKVLHDAGVRFALGMGHGTFSASNGRNLPYQAAMAVAYGLPRDVAIRALSLTTAEILGVDDRIGSLEAGKEASFSIIDGDPLEIVSSIEGMWIAGREIDLTAEHQYRLYQKYLNRPRPAETR
ncbi:MAG: amidohydrolase family protein, partial [Acidobacteriota bacterium]